jgi:hypothetical protein
MKIEKFDVDYEPTMFVLKAVEGSTLEAADVERFLDDWMSRRDVAPVCRRGCSRKRDNVEQLAADRVEIAIQWLCDECMEVLFPMIAAQFPNVASATVGFEEEMPPLGIESPQTVAIYSRKLTMEDGRSIVVGGFEIESRAVSVQEFRAFCVAAGYVTSAERLGQAGEAYDDNATLEHLSAAARLRAPAFGVSYNDAVEYCAWTGHRLPTEAEYVAAALIDDEIHQAFPGPGIIQEWLSAGRIVAFLPGVMTATTVGTKVVCRYGPSVVKLPGWDNGNRWLFGRDQPGGYIFACMK